VSVKEPVRRLTGRLRDVLYVAVSAGDRVFRGRGDGLLPPWHLRKYYYGTGDPAAFTRASAAARTELISRGLRPEHRVLDIGCGVGNLAIGLSGYLTAQYDGFDIHRGAVTWCQQAITPRHPSFRFHHADLSSVAYNADGSLDASTFRFPMPSAAYDVVFLGSVFTHLLPDTAAQYINEIARLLAPGGLCIASYFLLNAQSRAGIDAGTSFMAFPVRHPSGLCLLHDAEKPEAAVALDEEFVVGTHQRAGLHPRDIRRGGWWSGQRHDQDVIAAERVAAGERHKL
jgi:SAM-dependent methyltransferase